MANNITLQQNRVTSAQNQVDINSAKGQWLPNVNFSTNHNVGYRPFSQSTINLTNGTMTTTSRETNYNGNYGINASWTVWNGGRREKNIQKNEMAKQLADLQTDQSANTIQQQIAQLYVQILYEYEAVKVDSEIVKFSKLQRDRAQEMMNVGNLARVDVAQLEAQVTQDEYSLVSAQLQLENYKLQLKQLLEIHTDEAFNVAIPDVLEPSVLAPVPDKNAVYQYALGIRPEIQSGKLNIDASKLDEKIAKAGYLPTVTMSASMGSSNSSGIHTNIGTQLKNNWSNTLGLTLSVPIFDQKQTRNQVARAKLSTLSNELQLKNTEKQLYTEIENYWLQATAAQQQYLSAKTNVKSMKESYDLVSEQFNLGLKNIVELTTGKNNLLAAQQQLLQSKYTALYNLSMLRFYEGQNIKL
ncbi:MAG: TolC family protein [Bacteroidaceae bacterium]|nr:TolC family protein [Bacteroidaceae bacterium]